MEQEQIQIISHYIVKMFLYPRATFIVIPFGDSVQLPGRSLILDTPPKVLRVEEVGGSTLI